MERQSPSGNLLASNFIRPHSRPTSPMANPPDDSSFTPSMNRLLFLRHQVPPDIAPEPGVDPFKNLDAPVASSRTPTVRLDVTAEPPVKEEARRRSAGPETVVAVSPKQRASASSAAPPGVRYCNERRSSQAVRLFVLNLVIMLVCFGLFGAMIYSFYEGNVLPRFPLVNSVAYVPPELSPAPGTEALKAELAAAQSALLKANDSIMRLQRQYDALAEKQQNAEGQMSKLVGDMKAALAKSPEGKPTDTAASLSAALQVASVVPVSSSTNQELWLLKERNRLTFYADKAISQGSSEAMASLWLSLGDPELARLRDGIQAEIIRVQNYYTHLTRVSPDYRLPVRELFRDPAIRSEADLKATQVIPLLLDVRQPLEVRVRAAYVLGGQRSKQAAEALVKAMKNDPLLDVVKEAQRTLEEDYQMRVAPLNSRAADEWWSLNAEKIK